ncbi:MAG: hypothetical protein QM528_05145 [Phycisphaerales bacterium]|nr:hypothetical protein [Phycisphaerales bacterium]
MSSSYIIEFVLAGCIVWQIFVFLKNRQRIRVFQYLITEDISLTVKEYFVSKDEKVREQAEFFLKEISEKGHIYETPSDNRQKAVTLINTDDGNEVTNIHPSKMEQTLWALFRIPNAITVTKETRAAMFKQLNMYLIKNSKGTADFAIMKESIQHRYDSIEQGILQTLYTPLYIGLLGTFFGIVIGIWEMSGILNTINITDKDTQDAIGFLLSGVKLAMIGSFTGLFLTLLNSSFAFKSAKDYVEEQKMRLLFFLQTDLLPHLNLDINDTLTGLNFHLTTFNENFVGSLRTVFGDNREQLQMHKDILERIERLGIDAIATNNVRVFKKLGEAAETVSHFTLRIEQLERLLAQTDQVLNGMNSLRQDSVYQGIVMGIQNSVVSSEGILLGIKGIYDRIDNLNEDAAVYISKMLIANNQATASHVQDFLKFSEAQLIALNNSVSSFNNFCAERVTTLQTLISEETQRIKNFSEAQLNALNNSVSGFNKFCAERVTTLQTLISEETQRIENTYPERWEKLDQLDTLQQLNNISRDIEYIKNTVTAIKENKNNKNTATAIKENKDETSEPLPPNKKEKLAGGFMVTLGAKIKNLVTKNKN